MPGPGARASTAPPVLCSQCGGTLHGPVRFCPYCGTQESTTPQESTRAALGDVVTPPIVPLTSPPVPATASSGSLPRTSPPSARLQGARPDGPSVPIPPLNREPERHLADATPNQTLIQTTLPKPALPSPVPRPKARAPLMKWIALAAVVAAAAVGSYSYWGGPQGAHRSPPALGETSKSSQQGHLVRTHLERDEVTSARTALERIPPSEKGHAEVVELREDIARRETRRDGALRAAKACLDANGWTCALCNAKSAQAIDRSSEEARHIVERISHLGLAPAEPAASGEGCSSPTTPKEPSQARPLPSTKSLPAAAAKQGDCDTIVAAGRQALQAKSYDQAIAIVNNAMTALGLCPEAQHLKEEAVRARDKANRPLAGQRGNR
jgi:hypothetical protein